MNPLFLLNHREAVCFLRQVPAERLCGLSGFFLQKVKKVEKGLVVWWKVVYLCHV